MSLLMFILTATLVGPAVDHSGVAPQQLQTPGRSIRLAVSALKAYLGPKRDKLELASDSPSAQGWLCSLPFCY